MKRRNFLRMSVCAGAAFAIGITEGCSPTPENSAIAEPDFLLHIMDNKRISDAGKDYLRLHPGENSVKKLENLLLTGSPVMPGTPPVEVHRFYNTKTIEDFSAGAVVTADGWVLAQTEARQCALYALINH